jgi:hypothetical protein
MDPIAAISSANSSSTQAAQRANQCSSQADYDNLMNCGPEKPGANLQLVAPVVEAPAAMNVSSAAHVFSDRMKNGFYMNELRQLVTISGDPSVSAGEKTAMLLDTQERIGLARVVSKMADKLSEGLQTVVTKSS